MTPYGSNYAVLNVGPLNIRLFGGNSTASLVRNGEILGVTQAVFQAGDLLSIHMESPEEPEATANVVIDILGASPVATWSITTAADLDPDSFVFIDAEEAEPGSEVLSNSIVLSGFSGTKTLSVEGGDFSLVVNGTDRGASADVTVGDTVQIKAVASSIENTMAAAVITLANYSTGWAVTSGGSSEGIVIASNTFDYNLRTDLMTNYGWDGNSAIDVEVTVMPGVIVGASSPANAAFATGAFPAGSSILLVNQGRIQGAGGAGRSVTISNAYSLMILPGHPGGPALDISHDIALDNSAGQIWGGGGGGSTSFLFNGGGLGGGGGAGSVPGSGGTYYVAPGGNPTAIALSTYYASHSGTPEAGGIGTKFVYPTATVFGGSGGGPGQSGGTCSGFSGYGGDAGAALKKNGRGVTWVGQGDVRGPIQ